MDNKKVTIGSRLPKSCEDVTKTVGNELMPRANRAPRSANPKDPDMNALPGHVLMGKYDRIDVISAIINGHFEEGMREPDEGQVPHLAHITLGIRVRLSLSFFVANSLTCFVRIAVALRFDSRDIGLSAIVDVAMTLRLFTRVKVTAPNHW
jgi:hypothetical protein